MKFEISPQDWSRLCQAVGANNQRARDVWDQLVKLYADRPYHNLDHVSEMLSEFETVNHLADDPNAVKMAIIFHDAIYIPGAKDNEQKSADLARQLLEKKLMLEPEFVEKVHKLITATRHEEFVDDPDSQLIADLDLLGLSKPWDEFAEAGKRIRQEFSEFTDKEYAQGHSVFMTKLASRGIYQTIHYKKKELVAQNNIRKLLARNP